MTRRIRSRAELFRFKKQFEDERRAAVLIVRDIRDAPQAQLAKPLPAEWVNLGMATELAEAAYAVYSESPDRSAALAELAIAVAERVDDSYPDVPRAQAVAHAYKELANAHRARSNYQAALAALDAADAALDDSPGLAHDQAIMTLARATTLAEIARWKEALDFLADAAAVFEDHGDYGRVAQCELLRGMIHQRRGRHALAASAYRAALDRARGAGHLATVGSTYMNLGVLAAHEGRVSEAMDALQQARSIFSDTGATVELARGRWGIGVALLAAGRFVEAIPLLRDARQEFRRLSMPEEAGLAGLDLAETYLALDRQNGARHVISKVIEEFRRSNLNERALVALRYLHDLPQPRRETAKHVRSYLTRLRTAPHLLFALPDHE